MKNKNEKIVKEIIFASKKVLEFTIEEDKILEGNLKELKQYIEDYDLRTEDYGIGSYEYGGVSGYDSQETIEINHEDINVKLIEVLNGENPSNIEDIIDFLCEKMKIEREFETEGKHSIKFELKIKDYQKSEVKNDKVIHTFTLYWK